MINDLKKLMRSGMKFDNFELPLKMKKIMRYSDEIFPVSSSKKR